MRATLTTPASSRKTTSCGTKSLMHRFTTMLVFALVGVLAFTTLIPIRTGSSFNTNVAYAVTSAEKQAEADAVAAQLNAWQVELDQALGAYYDAIAAHDEAIVLMDEAQGRIDGAQAIISSTQEKLAARAKSMYINGKLSFIEVLFGATSFVDFATRWELLNNINKENADLIVQNKTAKQEAEYAHMEYSEQEKVAADRLAEALDIKTHAEQIVAAYERELANLEAEVAELVRQEQEAQRAREAAAANNGRGWSYNIPAAMPVGGYPYIVELAYTRLGVPYVWGGNGPNVFDCSGLTSWCYAQAGFGYIGRTTYQQHDYAKARLPISEAKPGDILYWGGHVAIFIGNGQYIHAPSPGRVVSIDSYNLYSALVLRF